MKRKFQQWCSSISPISTKRTITSHLNLPHWTPKQNSLSTKTNLRHMTLEIQVLRAWHMFMIQDKY